MMQPVRIARVASYTSGYSVLRKLNQTLRHVDPEYTLFCFVSSPFDP